MRMLILGASRMLAKEQTASRLSTPRLHLPTMDG